MAGAPIPKLYGLTAHTSLGSGGSKDVTFGGTAVQVTTGSYFVRGYTAEGGQLVDAVQTAMTAAGLASASATISDDGFVTLSASGAFTVTWTNTTLRDILGFTGNLTSATSHTATEQAKYTWHPNTGPATMTGHPDTAGEIESDAAHTVAPSGIVLATKYYERTKREFDFRWLEDEYVWPVGSVTNRDYYAFWSSILSMGTRFRYFPDRTANASTDYYTYVADKTCVEDGMTNRGGTEQENASWSKLWKLRLPVRSYVAP